MRKAICVLPFLIASTAFSSVCDVEYNVSEGHYIARDGVQLTEYLNFSETINRRNTLEVHGLCTEETPASNCSIEYTAGYYITRDGERISDFETFENVVDVFKSYTEHNICLKEMQKFDCSIEFNLSEKKYYVERTGVMISAYLEFAEVIKAKNIFTEAGLCTENIAKSNCDIGYSTSSGYFITRDNNRISDFEYFDDIISLYEQFKNEEICASKR